MWSKIFGCCLLFVLSAYISGCASLASEKNTDGGIPAKYIVLMQPYTPSEELQKQEIASSQLLFNSNFSDVEVSELFVQRAEIEQRLGLRYIATLNLMGAIKSNSENALAYYLLAGLLADDGRHLEAYDAYDAALELSPKLDNVYLFRSIALYYGKREKMAYEDLKNYYQKSRRDPYAMLWLYIMEYDQKGDEVALANLKERFRFVSNGDNSTFSRVIKVILGERTEESVWQEARAAVPNTAAVESLCELYFFFGKYHQLLGQKNMAKDYFTLSIQTNVTYFVEYSSARAELQAAKNAESGQI